ncbi:helicase associated domain-containing protein [Vibrio coralliirubri]|uniref:helicase associated domain-containing protein n=1 Tax=Vibrio coralliirubri TaxID=1516159 RepID=UPI0022841887|nr:helicase associated domain-containing protein [Vibrio coralliirubri]MCY9861377.1 helicase associated domain-containing protein [Vibrio coralliirubri]
MEEYKAKTSGLNIPLALKLADGFCLGAWFYYHSNRYAFMRMGANERESFAQLVGNHDLVALPEWDIAECFLKAYWERFGSMSLQFKYKNTEGFPLGKWVGGIRKMGKSNKLNEKQLGALEKYGVSIEFDLSEVQKTSFEDGLKEFQIGYDSYKWLGINKGTVSDSGYPVGSWLMHRVSEMISASLGLQNMIDMAKAGCLPQFSDESTYWYEGINSLADAVTVDDVSMMTLDYVDALGFRLGDWLCYMRDLHLNGKLGVIKQHKLLSFGVDITQPRFSDWDVGYRELSMFTPKLVNADITRDSVTDGGYPIGLWVESNLRRAVNGRLGDEKIMFLKFVGQKWVAENHYKWQWEASLVEQKMVKHPVRKLSTYDDERNGNMLRPVASRYDTLQSQITRNTNLDRRVWSEGIRNILNYQIAFNGTKVPTAYVSEDGFPLGKWVSLVRAKLKSRQLSVSRLWILEAVGVDVVQEDKVSEVPRSFKVVDYPLERWLKDRKRQSMRF